MEAILRFVHLKKFTLVALMITALSGFGVLNPFRAAAQSATAQPVAPIATEAVTEAATLPLEHLVPKIISTRPHDPTAFTEGLTLVDGHLYESTGRYGQSTIREVNPQTGAIITRDNLAAEFFGEGISVVGDRIIQLTWKEGVDFTYDKTTLKPLNISTYNDEGWGMCYDGTSLYTSNGSSQITERDPDTLAVVKKIDITLEGKPIDQLNELECVDNTIYANVWQTDKILRIDKASGQTTALIDASGLITAAQRAALPSGGVLNGIAYDPAQDDFLITGKLWPWLFEVKFVPAS
jgi:glutamine cyclotransferase